MGRSLAPRKPRRAEPPRPPRRSGRMPKRPLGPPSASAAMAGLRRWWIATADCVSIGPWPATVTRAMFWVLCWRCPGAGRRVAARIAEELDSGHRSRVARRQRAGGRGGAPLAHRVGRPPSAPLARPSGRHGQSPSATGLVARVADVRFLAARRRNLGPMAASGAQRAAPAGDGAAGSRPATDFGRLRRRRDSLVRRTGRGRPGGAGRADAARADPRRRTRPSPECLGPRARRSTVAIAADAAPKACSGRREASRY